MPVGGARASTRRRTLTIAPVMDRVGFKAIDFTTSTHMGVAVRYKQEDPWERIRLMAAATPNTPLQFMSTGFRFISWETASPEFMALAFRALARNGIRRFCLADPMNDADANIACARMVKQGGGEYVIAALVYTLSPIHDDAHYVERRAQARGLPGRRCALHQGSGRPADAAARAHADSRDQGGDRRQAAGAACPLHDRARRARLHGRAGLRRRARCSARPARRPTAPRTRRPSAWSRTCARSGTRVDIDDEALAEVGRYFTRLAEAEGLPVGTPQAFDAALSAAPAAGRHGRHHAPAPRRGAPVALEGSRDRRAGPRARGAGLAHRDDAVRADAADAWR